MPDDTKKFQANEYHPAPPFDHLRNIEVGKARVPYIEHPSGGRPAGWVMPGGVWTTHYDEAMSCAMAMDKAMRG